jgi:hypothetical protein
VSPGTITASHPTRVNGPQSRHGARQPCQLPHSSTGALNQPTSTSQQPLSPYLANEERDPGNQGVVPNSDQTLLPRYGGQFPRTRRHPAPARVQNITRHQVSMLDTSLPLEGGLTYYI